MFVLEQRLDLGYYLLQEGGLFRQHDIVGCVSGGDVVRRMESAHCG